MRDCGRRVPDSTLKAMSCSHLERARFVRRHLWFALAASLLIVLATSAGARERKLPRSAKGFTAATVVEVAAYMPCGVDCTAVDSPATAVCLLAGDQNLVAEGHSFLHEERFTGLDDLAGKQVLVRAKGRFVLIRTADDATVKLERGSRFLRFRNAACMRLVTGPIVAVAYRQRRPARVPADAFPLPASGRGDYPNLFLWYQCALEPDQTTVGCRRWYRNGDSYPKEFYCARTAEGDKVGSVAVLAPTLSQEGRLVLKSGGLLVHDNRARTNELLDRPGEACR